MTPEYSAVYFLAAMFGSHWVEPIDESIELFDKCIGYGLETGDHQHMSYGIGRRLSHFLYRGMPLDELSQQISAGRESLRHVGDTANRLVIDTYESFIDWLGGDRPDGNSLCTFIGSESAATTAFCESGNYSFESDWYILLLRQRYLCGDYAAAYQFARSSEKIQQYSQAFVTGTEFLFYSCLTLAALHDEASESEQSELRADLDSRLERLRESSALCPENREHLCLLVEAERARILNDAGSAMRLYDRAAELAARERFLNIEALALELSARFWFAEDKTEFGKIYATRAIAAYDAMGATGKADDITEDLEAKRSGNLVFGGPESLHSTTKSIDAVDIATILKASQAIAAEILLDQLLDKFMEFALENVGGERIVLVLNSDGEFVVQGVREPEDDGAQLMLEEPLGETERLSQKIANYVIHTSEHLVLSEPARSDKYQGDSYVQKRRPKSVLCAPVINKGKLTGIVYIENNQIANAFTPDRLETLTFLLSQIAVSIESASLYAKQEAQARRIERANDALRTEISERKHAESELSRYRDHLEDLVAQRTRELEAANEQLTREARGREEALAKLAESNEQIRSLAYLDGLTGLPNRRLLNEHLEKILARSQRKGLEFAVLFVDLDNFKLINDTIGHQAADAVLCDLADAINELLRSEDVLALYLDSLIDLEATISAIPVSESILSRLGGDEFVVLLTEIRDRFAAGSVAQRIIERLEKPFIVGGNEVFLSTSVGIATFPQDGQSAEVLLRNADTAMYHAKQQGKTTYQYYSEEMNRASVERLTLEGGLRRALEEERLELHYQPQIDVDSGKIVGLEALIRWNDPIRGYISPSTFIPVAESSGLILQIGDWIMNEACSQFSSWTEKGIPQVPIAVNVSGAQFKRQDICTLVKNALRKSKIEPGMLKIEITETSLMSGLERAAEVLDELRRIGVTTALDDFGTGYSSLSYLRTFPLDTLKIDRSFIAGILDDKKTAALTEAIIDMTQTLGLDVIAEGVETAEQLELLRNLGCQTVQGHYFSPAIPAEEMEELLVAQPVSWRYGTESKRAGA